MRCRSSHFANCAVVLLLVGGAQRVFAHGGAIEIGEGASGPVTLTSAQQAAIGLKTAKVETRDIDTVLVVNGRVQLDPNFHAHVTSRIEGRIEKLYAGIGDRVKKGQKLAEIESRQIGNPPPVGIVDAPLSGVINERSVTLGEAVDLNKELFHVIDLSQVIVVTEVYEEDVGRVKLGQRARVHALGYPSDSFEGKTTFVGLELDPDTRTLPLWVTMKNPEGKLKPEMFAKVAVILARNESVLAVPKEALLEAGGEKFVFVQTGDTFDRVDVQTGAMDDRFVEIKEGLVPDDAVVTDGNREVYTSWLTGGPKPAAAKK